MPRPAGQHPTYNRADRLAWRVDNFALASWLDTQGASMNDFILSVRDDLRFYGSLTPAQTITALRLMGEAQDSLVTTDAAAEAGENDALGILNGVYTLNNGTEHLTYRIHTVLRGPLQGKRIVKIQQQYGEFKGFAFLRADGHLKVWRRFLDDERRSERYIVWAGYLLDILRRETGTDEVTESVSIDGITFEVQRSLTCRRCNRPLTVPSSIDAGLGPECAQREGSRTTAARQHEQVATPLDLDTTEEEVAARGVSMTTFAVDEAFEPEHTEAQSAPAAQVDPDENLSTADLRALLAELGRTPEARVYGSPVRERMGRIHTRMWGIRNRCCLYCGRSDFSSSRGCTTHVNNYCEVRRAVQAAQLESRREANEARLAAQLQMAMANPNRSALGTVIDGEVWLQ